MRCSFHSEKVGLKSCRLFQMLRSSTRAPSLLCSSGMGGRTYMYDINFNVLLRNVNTVAHDQLVLMLYAGAGLSRKLQQ